MSKLIIGSFAAVTLISSLTLSSAFAAEKYEIDGTHSAVIFGAKHAGASYTKGLFRKVSGKFTFDEKNPSASSIEVVIDAGSIYTNEKKRDEHLKSPDFLNAKQFPQITFKSEQIKQAGSDFEVSGKLTLHGVTKPVMVTMTHVGAGVGPYGKFHRGFEGSFTVKRSDFGMSKMIGPVGDEIMLTVSIEGIRQ